MRNDSMREIKSMITKSMQSKQNVSPFQNNNNISRTNFRYRQAMVNEIKTLSNQCIKDAPNRLDIFYLSILYLDLILSKTARKLYSETDRKIISLCCFNLSLKFIGIFDTNIMRAIQANILKYQKAYSIYENKCLLTLNYDLVYYTAYDYLNMILLQSKMNKKQINKCLELGKSILYSFILNDEYINYSPFSIALCIIKYCKDKFYISLTDNFDNYFKNDCIKKLTKLIQSEFKDHIEEENWDLATMSSTLREDKKEYNQNTLRTTMKPSRGFRLPEAKAARGNSVKTHQVRRNLSISSFNAPTIIKNIQIKPNFEHKVGINLNQMSRLPFEQLARLSIRYLKTEK